MQNLRFYANLQGELKIQEGGNHSLLIASRFNQSANKEKCIDYLESVAEALNQMEDEQAAFKLVHKTGLAIQSAETAERFLQEVTF